MKKILKRIGFAGLSVFLFLNILCAFQAYHLTRFSDEPSVSNAQQLGFFERSITLLFGETYPKSKVADSLKIPHTDITIETADGFKLAGWKLQHVRTGLDTVKGIILLFHGHGSNRSALIVEACSFYELGWNVLMFDFRAHGQSQGNECSVGYVEANDVKAVYDYAVADGERNIVLWGISMGAATIIKAMHDFASVQPSRVILEMPFGTMYDAVKGRLRIMEVPQEPLAILLTFWGGTELGIWAFSNKPEEYAKSISCPALLEWGAEDPRVSRTETENIFKNLSSKEKTYAEYKNAGHESLCKNDHAVWMQYVTSFLK